MCLFHPIPAPAPAAAAATYLTVRPSGGGSFRILQWAGIKDLRVIKKFSRNFSRLVAFAFRQHQQTTMSNAGLLWCRCRIPITDVYPFAALIVARLWSRVGGDLAKGFRTDLEAILIIFNMVQFRWHKLDCHHRRPHCQQTRGEISGWRYLGVFRHEFAHATLIPAFHFS